MAICWLCILLTTELANRYMTDEESYLQSDAESYIRTDDEEGGNTEWEETMRRWVNR